jgi:hypothetical protein
MTRTTGAAVQVGEFAAGAAIGYIAVGAAWAATAAIWTPVLVAIVLVAVAVAAEVRYGDRVLGLVAGTVPAAVVTAGALTALSAVLGNLRA